MKQLIESYDIWNSRLIPQEGVIITPDPAVYEEAIRAGLQAIPLSLEGPLKEIHFESPFASDLSKAWVKALNTHYGSAFPFRIEVGNVLFNAVYALISTAFFYYDQLLKLQSQHPEIIFPCFDVAETHTQLIGFSNNTLLSKLTQFPRFSRTFKIQSLGETKKNSGKFYEVIKSKKISDFKYYLLGFLAEPTLLPFHVFSRLLPTIKLQEIHRQLSSKTSFLILSHGPQISVLLPRLLRQRRNVLCLDESEIPNPIRFPQAIEDTKLKEKLVRASLESECAEYLSGKEDLVEFLAKKVAIHTRSFLIPLADHLSKTLIPAGSEAKKIKSILLTTSKDTVTSILSSVCAELGVPTITFQEGMSCMLKLYKAFPLLSFINGGHAFVSRAPHEEIFFKKQTRKFFRPFYNFGTHDIQKSYFPRLCRSLGRSIWGIKGGKKAVFYFPRRFSGTTLLPFQNSTDIDYWIMQKTLVTEVFGPAAENEYFIKVHKKGLFSTPDSRMHPLAIVDLPAHIHLKESPDLRFMRFAADILIIDSATSTFGWSAMAAAPLIYLNSADYPLEDEVLKSMAQGFFVISVGPGKPWQHELKALLSLPREVIGEKWRAMAAQREKFLVHYVKGFKRQTKDLLGWIDQISQMEIAQLNELNEPVNESFPGNEVKIAVDSGVSGLRTGT